MPGAWALSTGATSVIGSSMQRSDPVEDQRGRLDAAPLLDVREDQESLIVGTGFGRDEGAGEASEVRPEELGRRTEDRWGWLDAVPVEAAPVAAAGGAQQAG